MAGERLALQSDSVLLAYLEANDECEADAALELLLVERAQPLVRDIIRSKLRVGRSQSADVSAEDFEDLVNEIALKLLKTLRHLRTNADGEAIENFRGYLAVTAYHACDEYFRRKYPRRYSLKSQLRYILTHRAGLAIWEDAEGVRLCGFGLWRERPRASRSRIQDLLAKPGVIDGWANPRGALSPPDLLAAIFDYLGGPLELDHLVSVVAEIWQVKDQPQTTVADADAADHSPLSGPAENLDLKIDQRSYLHQLWREIGALPPRQRVALLLNLKDSQGCSVVALLPLLRVASVRQIAETLAMTAESLATLWNKLPLNDEAIAEYIGVTRQQVINLRKCARERLRRRTREFH